ncbi:MAG TPA: hypothetical protein VMJ70_15260 [Candidatus Sulfotelmatobacter sp.]|nr:hypothetical protein [Candidatus Sulfotelmatobacter sp.]
MSLEAGKHREISIIPILRALIGGSAAIPIRAAPDILLVPAGGAMVWRFFEPSSLR